MGGGTRIGEGRMKLRLSEIHDSIQEGDIIFEDGKLELVIGVCEDSITTMQQEPEVRGISEQRSVINVGIRVEQEEYKIFYLMHEISSGETRFKEAYKKLREAGIAE